MRYLFTMLLASAIGSTAFAQPASVIRDAETIIRHANVITMQDSIPLTDYMVCLRNGLISYIGKDNAGKLKNIKATVIDATGQYLLPGMAEMHAHLPPQHELKQYFALNLAAGVTTIRSMRGKDEHIAYRHITQYPVPDLYLGSPVTTHLMDLVPERADSLVRAWKGKGFDFIKVLGIKDRDSYKNLVVAAAKHGIKLCGHVPSKVGLDNILDTVYNCVEHLQGYVEAYKVGQPHLDSMLTATKENNVSQCPTLDWYRVYYLQLPEEELKKRIGVEYVHDTVLAKWHEDISGRIAKMSDSALNTFRTNYAETQKIKLEIVRQMHKKGINIMTGIDGGDPYMVPGYNMLEEMGLLKQAGLSNYEVLCCATKNVASYMNIPGRSGTIETGKEVNMILLPQNPLHHLNALANVRHVFLHNNNYTREQLLQLAK